MGASPSVRPCAGVPPGDCVVVGPALCEAFCRVSPLSNPPPRGKGPERCGHLAWRSLFVHDSAHPLPSQSPGWRPPAQTGVVWAACVAAMWLRAVPATQGVVWIDYPLPGYIETPKTTPRKNVVA